MSDIVNQTFTILGSTQPASALGPDDYCSAIQYTEVDICHIRSYLSLSAAAGCCLPISTFFGLGNLCRKASYPVPTDAGVPRSLPVLPLGYHYPQNSTDRTYGRSGSGVFAKERGKIYIAPWIQSTETVVIKWDGIKRTWADADVIDDDPLLRKAVFEYMRWQHADKWDKDTDEAARAIAAYAGAPGIVGAREMLIHQCREETRARGCETSHARSSPSSLTALYYNEEQSATATCPDGTTGTAVVVTIPAGTVASNLSVSDANQKAKDEALSQAQSRLDCTTEAATYTNDAQTATASCQGSEDAPTPEGQPVTVTVPAGTVESTVSKADANAQALALAQTQAAAQLSCTFWNAEKSYTATCANNGAITKTVTIAAHTYSSTVSQSDADAQALLAATTQAEAALPGLGCSATTFYNTAQGASASRYRPGTSFNPGGCSVLVTVNVAAGHVSSTISQADANQKAQDAARQYAETRAQQLINAQACGAYVYSL